MEALLVPLKRLLNELEGCLRGRGAGVQRLSLTLEHSRRARTRMDLDFASPVSGLGSKMGIDATNKWPGETNREWGTTITMTPEVKARIDSIWQDLGI